jgi:hypothetical protein
MRKPKSIPLAVTLFPFMDVLTGVIGVLILITCALAVIGLNQSTIVFDLTNLTKNGNPIFIECLDDRVIVYDDEMEEIALGEDRKQALASLVQRLEPKRLRSRLVLAIRPSGVETFRELEGLVERSKFKFGYEPMPADQQIKIKRSRPQ